MDNQLKGKLLDIYNQSITQWDIIDLSVLFDNIIYFGDNDPSGTYKYVKLMVNILMNENHKVKSIVDLINRFHSIENKLSSKIFSNVDNDLSLQLSPNIKSNPKDIQQYKSYKDFDLVYRIAINHTTKKDKKDIIINEESDIVYDGDDYLIVVPLSFESSCFWGVDTKWCTTSKNEPHYFQEYHKNGSLFYVIDKYRQNEKDHPMSKFAIHVPNSGDVHNCDIYNRPDHSLTKDVNRILPPKIIQILKQYVLVGCSINSNEIYQSFFNYKDTLTILPLQDEWIKVDINLDGVVCFSCEQFPSYNCHIKFIYNTEHQSVEIQIKWLGELNTKMIATNTTKTINKRELILSVKRNRLLMLWNDIINEALDDNQTYILIKRIILNHVIHTFILNSNKNSDWKFTIIDHKLGFHNQLSVRKSTPHISLTDLGTYSFAIKGDYEDLCCFIITAKLDFTSNTFILCGGESNEITWNDENEDFILLYYNEVGLIDLLNRFKFWIIQTISTKSEKIIHDLYNDTALKVISKSSSFDEYLKSSDGVNTKFKPHKKSKEIVKRNAKNNRHNDVNKIINDVLGDINSINCPF